MELIKYRTISSIVSDVEYYFSFVPGAIKEQNRSRTMVKARKLIVHLCREYSDAGWSEIADFLHKDQSTMTYLYKKSNIDISLIKIKFDELYKTDWVNPRS